MKAAHGSDSIAHDERARRDEGTRARRAPHWWVPVGAAAFVGVLGWIGAQLLELDRTRVDHAARLRALETQFQTIDVKLDRLIERK